MLLSLLCACVSPRNPLPAFSADLPAHTELEDVTFYRQDEHQCGPAALAMLLQHAGTPATPEQLQPYLYLPEKQGSLQAEMLATARRHGLIAQQLEPRLDTVLHEVAAGHPVLVLQNLGFSWYPVWHYAVVIGYDSTHRELILHSGLESHLLTPLEEFERTWAPSTHWAMTALPPERIARTVDAEQHVRSLLALAHSDPTRDLTPAYAVALQRWPHALPLQIAAANYSYQQHDLKRAQTILEQSTRDHPEAVIAWNNLAQVLGERGNYPEAMQAARQAVALGGPLNAQARQTLKEIEQRIAPKAVR